MENLHFQGAMGIICGKEKNNCKHTWEVKNVTCQACKELYRHLESLVGKLQAENIHINDTEKALKALDKCVTPVFLIEIYHKFKKDLLAIARENAEKANEEFNEALKKQFGENIFLGDYRYNSKAFDKETKEAAKKYEAFLAYSSNWPYHWNQYLLETFKEELKA